MGLSEELKAIQDKKPDDFTIAWWSEQLQDIRQGYRGATHAINRSLAEYESLYEMVVALKARCDKLEEAHRGALAEIARLNECVAKAREAFIELKNKE